MTRRSRTSRVRRLRHILEYALFRCIAAVIARLPIAVSELIADGLGRVLASRPLRKITRYQVARENLQTVYDNLFGGQGDSATATASEKPDVWIDRTIQGMWCHLVRMLFEVIQLPRHFSLERVSHILEFEERESCVTAMCSGRPLIFLSGHFGNWEISVSKFGDYGFPMGVVARALDNPLLHDWFQRFREASGHRLIDKSGAGSEVTAELESGGRVAMLADQDAGPKGMFVNYFGRPASTFKSIAILAMQYDALVIVGGARRIRRRQGDRWSRFCVSTEAVLDPRDYQDADGMRRLTEDYTAGLERLVRKAPEQYFWVHRRWKSKPRARRRTVPRAA